MYQKPDFMKVSVKVQDVFSGYLATGCPYDEETVINYTVPCTESDPNYSYNHSTYVSEGWGHQCYTIFNP